MIHQARKFTPFNALERDFQAPPALTFKSVNCVNFGLYLRRNAPVNCVNFGFKCRGDYHAKANVICVNFGISDMLRQAAS